jgi:hypothetical protein
MRQVLLAAALALASSSTVVLVAAAQDAGPRCAEVRPGFVQCTETEIVGRRPSAYFLLGRARDRYEPPPLERGRPAYDLARTVRRAPF